MEVDGGLAVTNNLSITYVCTKPFLFEAYYVVYPNLHYLTPTKCSISFRLFQFLIYFSLLIASDLVDFVSRYFNSQSERGPVNPL